MAAITRIHKSGYHHSQSEHRDVQQMNTNNSRSIVNFNMLLAILDGSHYQTQ